MGRATPDYDDGAQPEMNRFASANKIKVLITKTTRLHVMFRSAY